MEAEGSVDELREALIAERQQRKQLEKELERVRAELTHDVGDRTKELQCLLQVTKLITDPSSKQAEVFQGTVALIPPSWHFSDIASARIVFGEQEYISENFADSPWKMQAPILVSGEELGVVEVCYSENRKARDQELFLREERALLDAIAQLMADAFIRYRAEEAWQRANEQLEEKVEGRTRELEEARDQAEAANEAKSRFLANMSHEIRSPLNAILGFAQIMISQQKDLDLPPKFRNYLNNIRVSGQNLSEIINDILDLSKIEAGRMTLYEEDLNLKQLVQGIFHMYKPQATDKSLDFKYAFGKGFPEMIRSDRTKIKQILMNLVSNALKFTPAGGSVIIDAGHEQERMILSVTDSGVGIPSDRLKSIFDPFVQADNTTTRQFGGTGLGLAISKKMVELLGGVIEVESEIGVGSVFRVRIPLMKAGVSNYSEEDIHLTGFEFAADNKVLVVEDNPMNREMIEALFAELGLQVLLAENGQEGVRMAYDRQPDLILMDIHMPVMDGLECTRRIRLIPECQDVPIIALSADAFKEQQRKAFEVGVTEYLPKPIDLNRLLPLLLKWLRHKGSEQQGPSNVHKGSWPEEARDRLTESMRVIRETPIFETESLIQQAEALELLAQTYDRSALELIEQLKNAIYEGDEEALATHLDHLQA